jgi:hypothetical protein
LARMPELSFAPASHSCSRVKCASRCTSHVA